MMTCQNQPSRFLLTPCAPHESHSLKSSQFWFHRQSYWKYTSSAHAWITKIKSSMKDGAKKVLHMHEEARYTYSEIRHANGCNVNYHRRGKEYSTVPDHEAVVTAVEGIFIGAYKMWYTNVKWGVKLLYAIWSARHWFISSKNLHETNNMSIKINFLKTLNHSSDELTQHLDWKIGWPISLVTLFKH